MFYDPPEHIFTFKGIIAKMSAPLLSSHLHATASVPADLPCLHPLAMLLACTSPVPLSSTASSYVCSLNSGSLPLTVLTSRMLLSVRRRAFSFASKCIDIYQKQSVDEKAKKKKKIVFYYPTRLIGVICS